MKHSLRQLTSGLCGLVGFLILVFAPRLAADYQAPLVAVAVAGLVAWRFGGSASAPHPAVAALPPARHSVERYLGKAFTLAQPIANGRGTLHIDGVAWPARGADCAAGETVVVTGVDGGVLQVERG